MLNEAIKDEGDILITRLGQLRRGQTSHECEDSIMLNRNESPGVMGLIIQKLEVEETGCQRIKPRRKEKSHDKKFIRQQKNTTDP